MNLKNAFTWVLGRSLPDRTKRIVLISSLLGCLHDKRYLEDQYLELLNQRLGLATEYQELKFPMVAGRGIWPLDVIKNINIKNIVNESDFYRVAQVLLTNVPSWLNYNNRSAILDDLAQAIRFEVSVGNASKA